MDNQNGTGPPRGSRHLTQDDVAFRLRVSPRTLERWRYRKEGPAYIKAGGRVVYRLIDVQAFEATRRHAPERRDPFFRAVRA